jgi:hypothetical protein
MEPFATTDEVEELWRPLTDAELEVVEARLAQASRVIRHHFSNVDARITAGELDADLVADIAAEMVLRYMRNPEGVRSETIQDYSFTRDQTVSAGSIYLTEAEMTMLTPAAIGRRSEAFTVPQCGAGRRLDTEVGALGGPGWLGGRRRW